jgi:hypothetical protein
VVATYVVRSVALRANECFSGCERQLWISLQRVFALLWEERIEPLADEIDAGV